MSHKNPFGEWYPGQSSTFNQDVASQLTLEAAGKTAEIKSGNIDSIKLELHSYGFEGQACFTAFGDDDLDALLSSTDPIQCTLSLGLWEKGEASPPFIELKGLVTDKYFQKAKQEPNSKPLRCYEIYFADIAQVVWNHHFPISIYVDKTMKEVIQDQTNALLSIEYDWDVLEQTRPITAFSLEQKEFRFKHEEVSFYSFLIWYLYKENGILSYDYTSNTYKIVGEKVNQGGDPQVVFEWWVDPPIYHFSEPPRFKTHTKTHSPEQMSEKVDKNFPDYASMRRDLFDPQNHTIYPEQTQLPSKSDLHLTKSEIKTTFSTLDEKLLLDQITPGYLLTFKGDELRAPTWSADSEFQGAIFRVRNFSIHAVKMTHSEDIKEPAAPYTVQLTTFLESKEETYIDRPLFKAPKYPFYIQGTVISKLGDEKQSTYEINTEVPGGQYIVEVPLVGNESEYVVVPFTPNMLSGQYYFPYDKGEKVLLSMGFETAQIDRVLDWQPLTQLPEGIQGNQIVFASNGKNYYTLLRHEFEEGNRSVFTIEQVSSPTQKRVIEIKDETFTCTVVNPDKKTITQVFNEDNGATFTVKDQASGVTQTATFDGDSITHTSSGSQGTSTIVQKPDSVEISCKTFTVNSDDVHLNATNNITQSGDTKVDITSPMTSINASSIQLG